MSLRCGATYQSTNPRAAAHPLRSLLLYRPASEVFGYPAHFEDIAFVDAAFDLPGGTQPDADTLAEFGGAITDDEALVLREWLAEHGDEASEIAIKALRAESSL